MIVSYQPKLKLSESTPCKMVLLTSWLYYFTGPDVRRKRRAAYQWPWNFNRNSKLGETLCSICSHFNGMVVDLVIWHTCYLFVDIYFLYVAVNSLSRKPRAIKPQPEAYIKELLRACDLKSILKPLIEHIKWNQSLCGVKQLQSGQTYIISNPLRT